MAPMRPAPLLPSPPSGGRCRAQAGRRGGYLALLALILLAVPAPAQTQDRGPPLELEADELSYTQGTDTIDAVGNVEMHYAGYHLTAGTVSYDRAAGQVTASGGAVLTTPTGDEHRAQSFTLSGDMREGAATALTSLLADGTHFHAETGKREGGTTTIMRHAGYTPCPIVCAEGGDKTPTWEITAREVVHDQEAASVTYRNAHFRFFGVPMLYTPYFSHPDSSVERKSGFLPPRAGYASDLGAHATGRYYWAIDEKQDATVGMQVMTKEKPRLLGEWRRVWRDASLTVDGSVTRSERQDLSRDGKDDWRGHLFADALWDIDSKWRAGAQARLVTDDRVLRRYDIDEDADVLTNELYAERLSGRDYAVVRAMGFRDLRTATQAADQPHILPEARASFVGDAGSAPVPVLGGRWGVDASFLGLYRDGDGQDMRRTHLKAEWVGRAIADMGLVTDWRASLRQDIYYVADQSEASLTGSGDTDFFRGRFFPQAHVQSAYPMARPVGTLGGHGLRATLTPMAALTIGGDVNEGSPIPNEDSRDVQIDALNLFTPNRFPGLDRIEDRSRATYGLRGGLHSDNGGKLTGFVGQSYRFDDDHNPFPAGSGLEDQASDIVGQITARIPGGVVPGTWDLDYRTQLGSDSLESRRHELDLETTLGATSFGGRYLFTKALEGTSLDESREQVEARISHRVTENWRAGARILYDLGESDEGMREADFTVGYTGACTSWGVVVERRLTDEDAGQNETSVTFRLGLKNLGEFEGGS